MVIVNVNAIDKANANEQYLVIQTSGGLCIDKIVKMVNEVKEILNNQRN